ncbi:MAG: thioredoxin [Bacteroidaceae bacterium]|nr:thioredoxin [Bacteroidaceae bacterium]
MTNFEEIISSNVPVLVDFYAEWCGPCETMKPILEELKSIKGDRIRIIKVDVDQHEELAANYRIQSVPTFLIFKNKELLWRQSGVLQLSQLRNMIELYE